MARGSTVLGVAAMAAVGAGGVAVAADAVPAPIAVPDLPEIPDSLDLPPSSTGVSPAGSPGVSALPTAGDFFGAAVRDVSAPDTAVSTAAVSTAADTATDLAPAPDLAPATDLVPATDLAPVSTTAPTTVVAASSVDVAPSAAPVPTDPGEALRARIIDEATRQRDAAARAEREAAEKAAAQQAAREAAAQKVREQAAAAKAAAEAQAKADAEAAAKAESERLAHLAVSYLKPLASYTLTDSFGEASSLWANTHSGQDFAAPTGTPVHAIHTGTVTSAGWAGSYGYRVILTLDDGTELWYCHLSTMVVTSGEVITGDTIGRVGATGNVTSPHLHLEVRPAAGAAPIDPAVWLRAHDIAV
ncbi:peptidoglycan DD-metalloendopeptidase family protein [Streptomyces sp. NPDC088910]|uniref:M23 family metallopeptidase n=1 Tax=Streptomyces sp. NPDC088910 TaxID=3365911 RepID=UPI00380D8BD2